MRSRTCVFTGAAREVLAGLRRHREEQGITQRDAGERCGMTRANWQRVEVGPTGNPSFDCVDKMARAVGLRIVLVPVDDPGLTLDDLRALGRLARWYVGWQQAKHTMMPTELRSALRKVIPYAFDREVSKK